MQKHDRPRVLRHRWMQLAGLHLLAVISMFFTFFLHLSLPNLHTELLAVSEAAARLVVSLWWTFMQRHPKLICSRSRCDHMRVLCSRFGGGGWVWSSGRCEVRTPPPPPEPSLPYKPEVKPQKRSQTSIFKDTPGVSPHVFLFIFLLSCLQSSGQCPGPLPRTFCTRCKESHGCSEGLHPSSSSSSLGRMGADLSIHHRRPHIWTRSPQAPVQEQDFGFELFILIYYCFIQDISDV